MGKKDELKIAMYPWFAMGHLTTFLHISNKLAQRGHQIFFIVPPKTQSKLHQFNLHPHLIKFIPITLPHVDGLPPEAETTSDVNLPMFTLLRRAMDLTEPAVEALLAQLRPDFVFFDFAHWLPAVARGLGIKSLLYCIISPAAVAYLFREEASAADFMLPPPGFPPSAITLSATLARAVHAINNTEELGISKTFVQRVMTAVEECDAMGFKACREMEGPYLDFLRRKFKKPVPLAGPVLSEKPTSGLDQKWTEWLGRFRPKSVIYCAFGSEARLKREHFQEMLTGLELTGLPFLVALKPPIGADTVEEALPEGFTDRTGDRGIVDGGWVQQQLILSHPSVGCFVTHCGWASIYEGLVNECRMVLTPHSPDQSISSKLVAQDLKVAVEVEKGDQFFKKEDVVEAIKLVMDEESEIGKEIRANHAKLRDLLLKKGLEDSYIDKFNLTLYSLLE